MSETNSQPIEEILEVDGSCAVVFTEAEDGAENGFGYHLLTPAKYEDEGATELPMHAMVAAAVSVFLQDDENLNLVMSSFYDRVNEVMEEDAEGDVLEVEGEES